MRAMSEVIEKKGFIILEKVSEEADLPCHMKWVIFADGTHSTRRLAPMRVKTSASGSIMIYDFFSRAESNARKDQIVAEIIIPAPGGDYAEDEKSYTVFTGIRTCNGHYKIYFDDYDERMEFFASWSEVATACGWSGGDWDSDKEMVGQIIIPRDAKLDSHLTKTHLVPLRADTMITFINSKPWRDHYEKWRLSLLNDFHVITREDSDSAYEEEKARCESMLSTGEIHSYFIKRAGDPMPVLDR